MAITFAENLKKIRQEKGFTQDELGKKVGVHSNHISRYERGETSPSAEILKAFADALEVTIDELVVGNRKSQITSTIKDLDLLRLIQQIETLNDEEKETVKSLIDAFIFRQETKKRLTA